MDADLTKGERTRKTIIDAAHSLINRQGYAGTSMRQIAEQAGIALGGIYNHFSGKEEIFEEVVFEFHPINQVIDALENVSGETAAELVQNAGKAVQDTFALRGDFLNLALIEAVEFNASHVPKIFPRIFPRALAFAQKIFAKDGELRDIDLPVIFMVFFGLMFAYYLIHKFFAESRSELFPKFELSQVIDIFLYGILADRAKEV